MALIRTCLLLFCTYLLTFVTSEKVFTDEFAVHIRGGRSVADELAAKYGYVNKGQIGELQDHYLFHHNKVHKRSALPSQGDHTFLDTEPMVEWLEQQHIKKRVKRDFLEDSKRSINRIDKLQQSIQSRGSKTLANVIKNPKSLSDPEYNKQWYMDRMNVELAWELGYTGAGVVVSILDDGIELNHPDLKLNFDQQASYDYNNRKKSPAPRYDYSNMNRHGTRCAGEVAMQADNGVCGVGIAYNASIGGVKMLDGDVTDVVEGESLSHARRHIDIYSASWGPDDDGRTVDGPGRLAKAAFLDGITQGRQGLGSIFVWASGNGGHVDDSCSCDGYTNSIYTSSISSTSENGASPWYLETCASTLATTYSSGDKKERKVVTTDLHSKCTEEHTGTSASAPLAAGIIALALQANPTLTWRDVQYLIVRTSRRENLKAKDWMLNGAGYEVSHSYGFGLMDARAMVEQAKSWNTLPEQKLCEVSVISNPTLIDSSNKLRLTVNTTACEGTDNHIQYLEHVQAKITLDFSKRGALEIRLTSPRNTESRLLQPRRGDQRSGGFNDWKFLSNHFWGEEASGVWTLEIENTGRVTNTGDISQWTLLLYGTSTAPEFPHTKSIRSNDETDGDPSDDSWDNSDWNWDSFSSDYDDENCHEECWDTGCDGPDAADCYKCKHFRDRDTQKCVQYCPDGQFPPTYLHERCKHCNGECKTCVGPTFYDCTSCKNGLVLLDGECLEECDDGYYKDKGAICHRCNDLCATCDDDPDNCQACVPGAVLDDNECKLSCPNGFYLEYSKCLSCHDSCDNCHGAEATDCISCDPDKVHKGNQCVDVVECGDGFYIATDIHGGEVSRECIACHHSCGTCEGFAYDDCLTCDEGLHLSFGECKADCKDGTYKNTDDDECHECQVGCRLCITEHICIACDDERVLNEGHCDEGCHDGWFEVEGECFKCHELCKECDGDGLTDCIECKQDGGITEDPRYLLEGACLPFCPVGYFMDDDSFTCKECDETCQKCNATQCTECVDSNVTPAGAWVCGENEHTGECNPSCATCMSDDLDQCLSCKGELYMFNYECIEECPKGYYQDTDRNSCRMCHPTCKECTGLHVHDCSSCDPEYVLAPVGNENKHQTCETHCHGGTYEQTRQGDPERACAVCHTLCETCDGPGEDECITCNGGKYLQVNWGLEANMPERKCVDECEDGTFGAPDDGECLPCHPSCKTCEDSPNNCITCIDGYEPKGRTCVNSEGCLDDQFTNGSGECQNCEYTCETCNGPTNKDCLTCDYYRFLTDEHLCNEVCPVDFYPDFDLNTCNKCHETCKGCVMGGPSDCLDCKPDLYSYPYDGQACVVSCPEGFYEFDEDKYKTCQQCSPECKDCHDSYWQCVSCEDGTYLYQDRCVNACPYYFGKGCEDGTYLYQDRCVNTCPYQYTEDDKSNHCVQDGDVRFPCPLHCKECDDWGDCKICKDNFTPYYGECITNEELPCPETQYPVINEKDEVDCLDCDSTCATCQGPGDNECLSCTSNENLDRGRCVLKCPDGMYEHGISKGDETIQECSPCHPSCLTCDGPAPNECQSCEEFENENNKIKYDEVHHTCHLTCPDHTFYSESDGGCTHCHKDCGTCDGRDANDCLTCKDGLYHFVDAVNNKQCVTTCDPGYYGYRPDDESPDNYECQECHGSCKTCFGETDHDCTSCPSDMNKQGFMCVTNCEEGYYGKDNICQQCNKDCETCSGPANNECMSCANDLYMQDGYCIDACTQGWFAELSGHRCSECHQRCLDCKGEGIFDCEACRENYILTNHTCYNRCELGKYWTNKTQTCEPCDASCRECFGPKDDHCISCDISNDLVLKRLDVNHSSCVRCCKEGEIVEPSNQCCNCNDKQDKCMKMNSGKGKSTSTSNNTATVVLGVILAIAFCLTVFCVLQARSKKMWCFKASYDRLPAYYDSKGNHVIMSKQYQHEKINVMSDDEDFYEDLDSEEEED